MNIAVIDAEIVGKNKHRFPNLAITKISSYHKSIGDSVVLKTDYENLDNYDKVFIAKVFIKTVVPKHILERKNVEYGGTGFFYDKAPELPWEIEHIMPDYHLYDDWVDNCIQNGAKEKEFTYYKDYSIGFLTRHCFRKCDFCVNRNFDKCERHSDVLEFLDESRPKLCFLDDNFFSCKDWKEIIQWVKATGKKFQFKQGLDERLLNDEKIHEMMTWKYDSDRIFAFDNIEDSELIESKLKRIFKLYPNFKGRMKFYVLCGFDREDKYDNEFWLKDIKDTLDRCFILAKYSALPYIMRYEKCYSSKYAGLYSTIASWANQPSLFKKFSLGMFGRCRGMNNEGYKKYKRDIEGYLKDGNKKGACWRYVEEFEQQNPELKYLLDIVPDSLVEFGNGMKT